MLRRNFIQILAGAVLVWPSLATGQTKKKVWRVAYLYPGSLSNPADHAVFDVFRQEMKRLGYSYCVMGVDDHWMLRRRHSMDIAARS